MKRNQMKAKQELSEKAKNNCVIALLKEGIPLKYCKRITALLDDIKCGRTESWKSFKPKTSKNANHNS